MTPQRCVDRAPAQAALPDDAGLPALAASLDREQVADRFERTGRGRLLECARHNTAYVPGVRCLSAYRLVHETAQGPRVAFGAAQATPAGLTLHWYDEDPRLPWLRWATDDEIVAAELGARGYGDLGPVVATPVRYRPGVRAVVRYDAATARGPVTFFGRVYADHDVDRHAQTHGALATLPDPAGALVSRPVGAVPQLHLAIEQPAPGTSASALLFDAPIADLRRFAISRSIGGALGALHASPGAPGPGRVLDDDLSEVRELLPVVAHADPALAGQVRHLADRIEPAADDAPWAPSHGAMRTDQVLVSETGRVTLLDLDGYCWADPSRDVGNLLAYLRWRAIRRPAQAAVIVKVRHAFLSAFLSTYRERVGDLDPGAIACFEAASLLKIAVRRYRSLRVTEWPLVPQLLGAAATLLADRRRDRHRRPSRPPLRLREASDLAAVGRELAAVAAAGLDGPPRAVRASVVACRPGQRALLRYDLADGAGRASVVFGKLFVDPVDAARTHRTLAALHRQSCASSGELAVPEPLGLLAALPVAVYRPVHGRFLDVLLYDAAATRRAPAGVAAAARWLAALHATPLTLERRVDLDREIGTLAAWASLVAERVPEHTGITARLGRELLALAGGLGELPAVPIHKDFHPRHVLVNGRLSVIDVDEARMGPPQLDVAHFCAYLHLLGLRAAAPRTAHRLRGVFVDEYVSRTHRALGDSYRFFLGWACLKIARQLATGRGLYPRPVGTDRDRQVGAMLRQGLAWLG